MKRRARLLFRAIRRLEKAARFAEKWNTRVYRAAEMTLTINGEVFADVREISYRQKGSTLETKVTAVKPVRLEDVEVSFSYTVPGRL